VYRLIIFIFVALMIVASAILDLAITPCMAESPRVANFLPYTQMML
jgi:hypothetical protein